ncbi:glycosyltransferase family 2 protein [Desulfosarcina ovata]|uniref:glycosyltransferase family 2 protein n=1 Tax=Desulfosarcina ovata TaxID=83564 RepID=UPI0015648711|nr:glycosyltransferase [Desulfosarcina ovata]
MAPLVSVVICTYNRAHLLERALESVFAQSYDHLEIIVIDDGSTDNTVDVLGALGNQVKYYRQENQGVSIARNVGLNLANGDFIAFHDDDDLMAADRIRRQVDAMISIPNTALVLADRRLFENEGKLLNIKRAFKADTSQSNHHIIQNGYESILRGDVNPVPQAALFKRRDVISVGGFDPRFTHGCEDTDFFARIANLGLVVYLPKIVCFSRKGHSSLTTNQLAMHVSRCIFFAKHIRMLSKNNFGLKDNLRFRMRGSLEYVAVNKSHNNHCNKSLHAIYSAWRYRKELGVKQLYLYYLRIMAKLCIR